MVRPGHFKLHARILPDLKAGDYVLEGAQTLQAGAEAFVTEQLQSHLRVTSPRYGLPPDQILSTFPPANSEGAYESRLPQIVLKRRTLPWEHSAGDGVAESVPWLALVVIAEGEGTLSGEVPVEQTVTAGKVLTGPRDIATGRYLEVPASVVRKVFPTAEDLPLLVHAREVDLDDTELALGDDDGFLAVVMANRLPQFDRQNCKPVRYMACLINLEQQLDVLPAPSEPVPDFHTNITVVELATHARLATVDPDHELAGATSGSTPDSRLANTPRGQAKGGGRKSISSWDATSVAVERVALSTSGAKVGYQVRDAMRAGFRGNLELALPERLYRFPVLTHWSFTCSGAGSFESYMRALDVGLLGTDAPAPGNRLLPPCMEPPPGTAPPPAPSTRPAPELAETGHVGLPYTTRRGDSTRAWYRGPLGPHATKRHEAVDGHLPLAHVSDQLRSVVPDGREDVARAAAFEIGRLLALSQPAVVSALLRWRRTRFSAERVAGMVGRATSGLLEVLRRPEWLREPNLGDLLGRELVKLAGRDPRSLLGSSRPLADPARPLPIVGRALDEVIARGLAVPERALTALRASAEGTRGSGALTALSELRDARVTVTAPESDFQAHEVEHLRAGLSERVDALVTGALEVAPELTTDRLPAGVSRVRGAIADALGMGTGRTRGGVG